MKNQVIGIYHKDCIDGTSSAAVLLRKFPDVSLFPLSHSYTTEDIEPIRALATEGAAIYTVDCALGVDELLEEGHAVTVIDHHIGSKEAMQDLADKNSQLTFVFNNEKSGASLTWSYVFPDEEEPSFIKYVEDADLWNWKFGDDTKYVNSYLSMFRNDPETMLQILEGDLEEIKEKGFVISQYADREIEDLVKIPPVSIKIGEHEVSAFNITTYQSACGNILSDKLDSAIVMFTIKGEKVTFSIRSQEHHSPSALELAQLLGGGGHVCASGARVTLKEFLEMMV